MANKVYFGSAKQYQLKAEETLPAKLDLILDKLAIRDRVKNEIVAIKMHLGGNVGYSTIHPVFVRKVVKAVKDGGGKPFVTDTTRSAISAAERGYSTETLGCPVYPISGLQEKYFYTFQKVYRNIQEWKMGGFIHDATFLIDFAHVKGHPSCSYGGAIKNLALGGFIGETRANIHDVVHFEPYWFPEQCSDRKTMQKIIDSCPMQALVFDKKDSHKLHLHFEPCNQCFECLKVAPDGALKLSPELFASFQVACAIAAGLVLSTFRPEKRVFINLINNVTPVCDCFGFTGMPILPDIGILGSDDIVAIEQASLDLLKPHKILAENLPGEMRYQPRVKGHPLQKIHGVYKDPYIVVQELEKLGFGSRKYELVDVYPVKRPKEFKSAYIPADER
ncbi:MAG: DUF362 domain-containing protein [bacterium]|nr:DUF362 domain-containing protein [bacterium]